MTEEYINYFVNFIADVKYHTHYSVMNCGKTQLGNDVDLIKGTELRGWSKPKAEVHNLKIHYPCIGQKPLTFEQWRNL